MNNKVLITGGAGFIGSHIAENLKSSKDMSALIFDVRTNNSHHKSTISLQGDIFNFDQLTQVMRDHEVSSVVHLVGNPLIPSCKENPSLSFRLNVLSVQNILEAMRLADVSFLVFSSTASVYGKANGLAVNEDCNPKPTTVYGFHKLAAESLIRAYAEQYDIGSVILRIFNVYGDFEKEQGVISLFVRKALANEKLIVKGGAQLRDFVRLEDVVNAFAKTLEVSQTCKNQTINVGSGVGLSICDITDMVAQHFPNIEIRNMPSEGNEYSYYADISKMKSLLGISPTDPRVGIPKFIEKCRPMPLAKPGEPAKK